MKRLMAGMALLIGTAALSGCYYDPGYSYVRSSGYQGDAYYGQGSATVYDDGYYGAPGYYGSGYYGGYAPGVSVGIGSVWYGGSHGRDRDDRHWRDEDDHDRGWQRGQEGDEAHYEHRGDDEHRGHESQAGHDRGHGGRHDDDGH